MIIETVGYLALLAGVITLWLGPGVGIYLLFFSMLLGAAAAFQLPSLGEASIMPAHALLPFYCLAVLLQPGGFDRILRSLAFPRVGFWLAAFVGYGIITAVFMPRMFIGMTDVFSLARDLDGRTGIFVAPLRLQASNITQPVYLLGDLGLFAAISAHILAGGGRHVVQAFLLMAACNVGFAAIDLATYATGTAELLEFIRNANYGILAGNSIGGFKRIVGSFTEASAFGGATLVFFVFSTELWLRRSHRRAAGVLAIISLGLLVFSTSTSAYIGLVAYVVVLWIRSTGRLAAARASPPDVTMVFAVPLLVFIVVGGLVLVPSLWTPLVDLFDNVLLRKLESDSAAERGGWNLQAWRSFLDTFGLGAGLGSVRASSIFVAILANMGAIGLTLFIVVLASLTAVTWSNMQGAGDPLVAAGYWPAVVMLVPATVAGTVVDMGLMFFAMLALTTARHEWHVQQRWMPSGAEFRSRSFEPDDRLATAP